MSDWIRSPRDDIVRLADEIKRITSTQPNGTPGKGRLKQIAGELVGGVATRLNPPRRRAPAGVVDYWRDLSPPQTVIKCPGPFAMSHCPDHALIEVVHVFQNALMSVPGYYAFCRACAEAHKAGLP